MPTPDRVVVWLAESPGASAAAVTEALAAHPRARTVLLRAESPPSDEALLAAMRACPPHPVELESPKPPPAGTVPALAAAGLRHVHCGPTSTPASLHALRDAGIKVSLRFTTPRSAPFELSHAIAGFVECFPWISAVSLVAEPGAPIPELQPLAAAIAQARTAVAAAGLHLTTQGIPACVADPTGAERRRPRAARELVWGGPCAHCALRPLCAGAPAPWWGLPAELGPAAPETLIEPWESAGPMTLQTVVRGFEADPTAAIRAARTPTVWLWTDHLREPDVPLPFTHLALELQQARVGLDTLQRLRRVGRPIHVGLRLGAAVLDVRAVIHALQTVGVHTVALLAVETWVEAELSLRHQFPDLDVRRIGPASPIG